MFEKKDNLRTANKADTKIKEHTPAKDVVGRPKFNVMSIEKISTPDGMDGDNWYQYVVGQGLSEVKGLTMGTLTQVTEHANKFVDNLNERSKGKKGGYSSNPAQKTPAKPVAP